MSAQTVKAYLRTAMRKLDVHNRTAAVHAARVAGLL
ncbi:LuxR C-terminal-related transcriptional regulator [Pseudonocardia saturnea]